jgi:flagellar basal-body rod protein FlgF
LSGAVVQERNLEVIADNLANVATPGFKGTRLSFQELVAAQPGVEGQKSPHVQVEIMAAETDLTQGPIKNTQNPLDVALRGPGYFMLDGQDGSRLTRQGSFLFAQDGTLRSQTGEAVMGMSGPIRARFDLPLTIDNSGSVYSGGQFVDQLRRVFVDSKSLSRSGSSQFRVTDGAQVQEVLTPVETGALEQSNVNAVTAMTQMINTQRHWEMYHRAIESVRNMEQKSSEQLG